MDFLPIGFVPKSYRINQCLGKILIYITRFFGSMLLRGGRESVGRSGAVVVVVAVVAQPHLLMFFPLWPPAIHARISYKGGPQVVKTYNSRKYACWDGRTSSRCGSSRGNSFEKTFFRSQRQCVRFGCAWHFKLFLWQQSNDFWTVVCPGADKGTRLYSSYWTRSRCATSRGRRGRWQTPGSKTLGCLNHHSFTSRLTPQHWPTVAPRNAPQWAGNPPTKPNPHSKKLYQNFILWCFSELKRIMQKIATWIPRGGNVMSETMSMAMSNAVSNVVRPTLSGDKLGQDPTWWCHLVTAPRPQRSKHTARFEVNFGARVAGAGWLARFEAVRNVLQFPCWRTLSSTQKIIHFFIFGRHGVVSGFARVPSSFWTEVIHGPRHYIIWLKKGTFFSKFQPVDVKTRGYTRAKPVTCRYLFV